jgi:hypothetical protein
MLAPTPVADHTQGTNVVSTAGYDIAMSNRGDLGKRSTPVRKSFVERAELEGLKKKNVGRLLLDGGTVEEPSHQPLVLNVPQTPRRRSRK